MARSLVCGDTTIDLSTPAVMGILNMTPDSFSDGGLFVAADIYDDADNADVNKRASVSIDKALAHARQMLMAGATIIDVGGESTRPGADEVSEENELKRVIPIIEAIKAELTCVISIDTSKAVVMDAALQAGATFINDVNALQAPGCLDVAVKHQVPVCIMHMQGKPRTMQATPRYDDVVNTVSRFLVERSANCIQAGLAKENIVIDPGFGFGKTVQHNLLLIKHLETFIRGEYPVMVGMSRKSTLGVILDKPVDQRLSGSLATAAIMAHKGANIFRVHDVAETIDVLKICAAINSQE